MVQDACAVIVPSSDYAVERGEEGKRRKEKEVGELLKETVEHEGGKAAALSSKLLPEGVSRTQSSRWQQRLLFVSKIVSGDHPRLRNKCLSHVGGYPPIPPLPSLGRCQ